MTENRILFSAMISSWFEWAKEESNGMPLAAMVDFKNVLLGNIWQF